MSESSHWLLGREWVRGVGTVKEKHKIPERVIITGVVGTGSKSLEEEELVINWASLIHQRYAQSPHWMSGTGLRELLMACTPTFPTNARKPALHTSSTWARHFPLPGVLF